MKNCLFSKETCDTTIQSCCRLKRSGGLFGNCGKPGGRRFELHESRLLSVLWPCVIESVYRRYGGKSNESVGPPVETLSVELQSAVIFPATGYFVALSWLPPVIIKL